MSDWGGGRGTVGSLTPRKGRRKNTLTSPSASLFCVLTCSRSPSPKKRASFSQFGEEMHFCQKRKGKNHPEEGRRARRGHFQSSSYTDSIPSPPSFPFLFCLQILRPVAAFWSFSNSLYCGLFLQQGKAEKAQRQSVFHHNLQVALVCLCELVQRIGES